MALAVLDSHRPCLDGPANYLVAFGMVLAALEFRRAAAARLVDPQRRIVRHAYG